MKAKIVVMKKSMFFAKKIYSKCWYYVDFKSILWATYVMWPTYWSLQPEISES